MPKTVQYMRRIAESHATDHELCDVNTCVQAARMAEDFPDDDEWAEHERRLDSKALMDEIAAQGLNPSGYFDDVEAVRADIATLDEEPDIVSRLAARAAIKLHQ
jgi:hypothetical protein